MNPTAPDGGELHRGVMLLLDDSSSLVSRPEAARRTVPLLRPRRTLWIARYASRCDRVKLILKSEIAGGDDPFVLYSNVC